MGSIPGRETKILHATQEKKKKKKMKKRKLEKDAAAPSGGFLLVPVLEPRNCPEFKTSQAPASRLQGFLEFQPS